MTAAGAPTWSTCFAIKKVSPDALFLWTYLLIIGTLTKCQYLGGSGCQRSVETMFSDWFTLFKQCNWRRFIKTLPVFNGSFERTTWTKREPRNVWRKSIRPPENCTSTRHFSAQVSSHTRKRFQPSFESYVLGGASNFCKEIWLFGLIEKDEMHS